MRVLSSRCSMWKLTRVPRAPEYRRTGNEMRPKVRYPVQTEAAMAHSCLVLGNSVVGCAVPFLSGQEKNSVEARRVCRFQPKCLFAAREKFRSRGGAPAGIGR